MAKPKEEFPTFDPAALDALIGDVALADRSGLPQRFPPVTVQPEGRDPSVNVHPVTLFPPHVRRGCGDYHPGEHGLCRCRGGPLAPGPEGFTSKERDAETGLDAFGARQHLSALGRWGSGDPLRDSFPAWIPYNYVLNDPNRLTDPDGRMPSCLPGCAADAINQLAQIAPTLRTSLEFGTAAVMAPVVAAGLSSPAPALALEAAAVRVGGAAPTKVGAAAATSDAAVATGVAVTAQGG